MAFMESRHFIIFFILQLLDLIISKSKKYGILKNVINAVLAITLSPDVLYVYE